MQAQPLSGPSTSSPSSLCRGRPWGPQSIPLQLCWVTSMELELVDPSRLFKTANSRYACKKTSQKPKVGEQTTTGSCPPLETGQEDHFPRSKLDATAHSSTRRSLLPAGTLQHFKLGSSILQNRNLGLEGFTLKMGKQASGAGGGMPRPVEHCNMPIKGFKTYLLKHTQKLRRV